MHGFPIKPRLYSRFLDDIFAVWPGTPEQLVDYQAYVNALIPGIKVTFTVRHQIIEFLDTQVYKPPQTMAAARSKLRFILNPPIHINYSITTRSTRPIPSKG